MSKITREICGDCYKAFTSLDWAQPAEELRKHKAVCPKALQ